jgi:hypothetical protein
VSHALRSGASRDFWADCAPDALGEPAVCGGPPAQVLPDLVVLSPSRPSALPWPLATTQSGVQPVYTFQARGGLWCPFETQKRSPGSPAPGALSHFGDVDCVSRQLNGFQDRRLRPLGHPSALAVRELTRLRCMPSRARPRRASPSSSWHPSQPSPSWGPDRGSAR